MANEKDKKKKLNRLKLAIETEYKMVEYGRRAKVKKPYILEERWIPKEPGQRSWFVRWFHKWHVSGRYATPRDRQNALDTKRANNKRSWHYTEFRFKEKPDEVFTDQF